MQRVIDLWGLPRSFNRFPGSQPISIERRHFPLLKQSEYVICDKSDGERFLCYIDSVNDENVCALINRKSEFEHIKLRPPRECYKGTLIDGEIVMENGKRIFLVFDVVAWAGKTVSKMKLPERMKYIMDNRRKFIHSPQNHIRVRPKVFSNLRDARGFKNQFIPTLKYDTDGYILTPIFDPVQTGTHTTMFKWKPLIDNTIDFMVKKTTWGKKNVYDMFIQEKGELIFETHLSKDGLDKQWKTIIENEDEVVLECKYEHGVWTPIRHRKDKTYPNSRFVFYRTLTNIHEDIHEEELLSLK